MLKMNILNFIYNNGKVNHSLFILFDVVLVKYKDKEK